MQFSRKILAAMSRWERVALAVFCCFLIGSLLLMIRAFYLDATVVVPKVGGTYIEGSVGEIRQLNPWFTIANDVNRDIVSLVFQGLLRYDPKKKEIVEDLATMQISGDGRVYTLKLKEDLFWHDTTKETPQPVTADDVLFTFKTIQDPAFPNAILRQNFRGVTVEKIDDRTTQFRLEKPYAFFASNLTLGLLPRHHFENVPADMLDQEWGFSLHPVGCGPYKFVSLIQSDFSTEVTLQRFESHPASTAKLERIALRVFPDYTTLLSDLGNLDGVRLVPRNEQGEPLLPRGFTAVSYSLPQYVAMFFNLDRPLVDETTLRLGLQLATDKQEIADALSESIIVDTPLLEIDLKDWRYHFDPESAQGALVESSWHLPEKVRLQRLQERREVNRTGALRFHDDVVYLETGALLTLTGSTKNLSFPVFVNGQRVQTGGTLAEGTWSVKIGTNSGQSGALMIGMNRMRLTDARGQTIDTALIERILNRNEFARARDEFALLERYETSKGAGIPEDKQLGIEDLAMEDGKIRVRRKDDPPSIRVNEAGQELRLTLLTSNLPASYKDVANIIHDQWRRVGVDVVVEVPPTQEIFEERMLSRNYDVLLFGQSLLDNLDSYPYWHSSQAQDTSGDRNRLKLDAFNLSQYTSFEADALLSRIRETRDPVQRQKSLTQLNELLKKNVPAIFLYSPLYVYGYRDDVQGVDIGSLSMHSDRFIALRNWYADTEREFKEGMGWLSFFRWLPTLVSS